MNFSEFPFLRYVLFFIIGILAYPYCSQHAFYYTFSVVFFTLVSTLYLLFFFWSEIKKIPLHKNILPVLAYCQLFVMGIVFCHQKDQTNYADHLLYRENVQAYLALVLDLDEEKPRSKANRLQLKAVIRKDSVMPARGEIIIYHQLEQHLEPGQLVYVKGRPSEIPKPANPHEFNYHKFLAFQQIYHSHFAGKEIKVIGYSNEKRIHNRILNIRKGIESRMDQYITHPYSNQIAKALLVGRKKNLEKEISDAYITAGAMHVLAVSGLHVGIVYGFFFLFFKPFQLKPLKRTLYLSLVIGAIWFYAFITGLSPSVLRAATMLSLMGVAQMNSRTPSVFNAIALSAFILMVFNPFILFSVGFQLSYLALIGILLLQPKIKRLWSPRNTVVNYAWEISCVSIAAQLATFPLSAYYFHIFPNYFLLTNLVVIPGAFLIMIVGVTFMVLSPIAPLGMVLGRILDLLIWLVNESLFSTQKLPFAKVEDINIHPVEMVLFWAMIVMIYLVSQYKSKKAVYFTLFLTAFTVANQWWGLVEKYRGKVLYVYALKNGLAIDYIYKGMLFTFMDGVDETDLLYKIRPNRIRSGTLEKVDLDVLSDAGSRRVFFPGGDWLEIDEDNIHVNDLNIKSLDYLENGNWKGTVARGSLKLSETAYRIVLE